RGVEKLGELLARKVVGRCLCCRNTAKIVGWISGDPTRPYTEPAESRESLLLLLLGHRSVLPCVPERSHSGEVNLAQIPIALSFTPHRELLPELDIELVECGFAQLPRTCIRQVFVDSVSNGDRGIAFGRSGLSLGLHLAR